MADRRRGKQRKREELQEKPTKEEYAVAKYLRFNLATREGKLVGMPVQCFLASKAVDMMLESKWGSKAKKDALFTSRNGCVDYCNTLLMKGLFHRAARVGRKKEKDREREPARKKKKTKEEEETKETTKEEKTKQEKKSKKKEKKKEKEDDDDTEKDKDKESEGEKEEKKTEEKKDEERKKKRKLRLEMHDIQMFKDGEEIYVWIYDPVPLKTFLIGLLLVLGAIAVCMFPLWPPEVRNGIYYVSLAAASFVGLILALCVVRLVLFCLVWGVTFGRHHFWFLPNLTEDVGFFDSFKPLYKHDYFGPEDKKTEEESKDDKESDEKTEMKDNEEGEEENKESGEDGEENDQGSEKEGSREGSEDNGYEIVQREEVMKEGDEMGDDEEEEGEDGESEKESEKESKKTK